MRNHLRKIMVVVLLVLMLPVYINAETYSNATSIAGKYLNRNDFKDTYSKYLVGSTASSKYYSNDSSNFTLGGLISKNEFLITKNGYNNSYSYLYEGYPFWTLTSEGSGRYVVDSADKTLATTNTTPKVRVTEYVESDVIISGSGTYSDPWLFAPQYKITINVNNSSYGYINEGVNKIYKKEFIVSADSTTEFTIGLETGYNYLGTTCGYILNDIDVKNKTSNKIKITGVTRDLECSINFGEKPLEINLAQSDNDKKSQPEKLYVLPNKGWFSDSIATSMISQISSNPEKTGYAYKGYYTNKTIGINNSDSCTGTLVINTDRKLNSTKSLLSTFNYGSTIYPCYIPNLFTVKYDKNDSLATGTMSDTTCTYGKDCVLTANAFKKTGYSFNGWVGSNGNSYSNGGSAKNGVPSGTLTLKASWNICASGTYSTLSGCVSCPTNYPLSVAGSDSITDCYLTTTAGKYVATAKAAQVSCAANGYCAGGTKVYYGSTGGRTGCPTNYTSSAAGSDASSDCYLTTTAGKYVATAKAAQVSCVANYYCAGGTKVYYGSIGGSSACATGYYSDAGASSCSANPYTITYSCNGGSGSTASSTHYYNTAKALTANGCAKTGYKFAGWKDSNGNAYTDKQSVKNLTSTKNASIALTAQWTPISYTVSFNANGGTGSMSNMSFKYGEVKKLTANTFERNGYSFGSWTGSNGNSYNNNVEVSNLTASDGATVTMTANWSANTYNVNYDFNGGSGAPSIQAFKFNSGDKISTNVPTRAGYTFVKWVSNPNSVDFAPGSTIPNGWGSFTLVAQWRVNFDILNSYKCANVTVGSSPYSMNYTGNCEVINDGGGNWRVKFTSSGTLTLSAQKNIDAFLVGGGGGGGAAGLISDSYGGGGGGGGYITTAKNLSITTDSYTITVGSGGSGGSTTSVGSAGGNGSNGGTSSIVGTGINKTASGGKGGKGGSSSGCTGGAGGSGGGAGGSGYALYSSWNKRYENMDESGGAGGSNGSSGGASSRGKFSGGSGSGSGNNREFGESSGNSYSGGGAGGFGQGAWYPMYGGYGSSSGGSYGGGNSDASATWYGGGGGGGGFKGNGSGGGTRYAGGKGYQGIVIIRNAR